MKIILSVFLCIILFSCNNNDMSNQSRLTNTKVKNHIFLKCMYNVAHFPSFLVDKCKNVLLELCEVIESQKPTSLDELYTFSHSATKKINDLEEEFLENDSEIETAAAECLALDFEFIAQSYGFENADVETLISGRNW